MTPGSSVFRSSESSAIFADISYDISDQLTLAVGTRYFEDERTFRQDPSGEQEADFDKLSSKLSLSYAFTDQASVYVRIAEGFRSGGFNAGQTINFEPESVISYEVGTKAQLLDGRLSADAAIFVKSPSKLLARICKTDDF